MRAGRVLAAVALVACGGAATAPAPTHPSSRAGTKIRFELLEASHGGAMVRSEACEHAIDALGERLESDGPPAAPDELIAVRAACPPPDAAAAEAVLDAHEERMVRMPASHDDLEDVLGLTASCPDCEGSFELACRRHVHATAFARFAWRLLADDGSGLWLAAQRCASDLVPHHTAALTLEHARTWAAAGAAERLADCLDGCALEAGTRAELERLERGDGYERRVRQRLADARADSARMTLVTEAAPILAELDQARADIRAHAGPLGVRVEPLEAEVADVGQAVGAAIQRVDLRDDLCRLDREHDGAGRGGRRTIEAQQRAKREQLIALGFSYDPRRDCR
jgi:hypothetical protein